MATSHSGAHMDALAHMTVGDDMHWYGGGNADEHLTDFGPTYLDAATMPPFFTRGVLLDAAGHRGVDVPAQGLADRRRRARGHLRRRGRRRCGRGTSSPSGPATWASGPTPSGWPPTRPPGPDISAARWLLERGRRRDRHRHRDVRGPAGARPGADRQPPAGPHAAAHRERHLPHGEPRPRGARPRAGLRVPLRRPAAEDPRRHGVDGRSRGRRLRRPAVSATMQALVVLEPNRMEIREVPVPTPGTERGAGPRPGGVDLRHRCPPHPRRLPGLLAAVLPVHPRARVGRRDRRARAGRRALRLEGRRPGRRHLARRLRRLPEVRRGPLQPLRELRAARPPQAVRPQRPGRRRRRTSCRASRRSSRCPTG